MRTRLSRLRIRDLALFVVVAGAVAVAALFAAREAGLGDRSAVAEGDPLTLTLTAQAAVCETERARWWGYSGLRTNEQGRRVREPVTIGWIADAVIPVRWQVSGGTAPYTLVIDGESRDVDRDYMGPVGTAKVGCADTSVGTFFQEEDPAEGVMRFYRTDPEIDSGSKTIRAVVTDADGVTAAATLNVYVILVAPAVMTRGQTYRVYGHLLTAPPTHDLEVVGEGPEYECPRELGKRCETEFGLELLGVDGVARLWLYLSDAVESDRWQVLSDGTVIEGRFSGATGTSGQSDVDTAFDLVVDSVDKSPSLDGN